MSTPSRPPVAPWIPPQQPQKNTPKKVQLVLKNQSPLGAYKAGLLFTAVLAASVILTALGLSLEKIGPASDAGKAAILTASIAAVPVLVILSYAYIPVILVLSIVTMCKGRAVRGILLLVGSPVFLAFTCMAGIVIIQHRANKPGISVEIRDEMPSRLLEPSADVAAVAIDKILSAARKAVSLQSDEIYQAAKKDAWWKAANDPNLRTVDRETVRTALDAIFSESDMKRKGLFQ